MKKYIAERNLAGEKYVFYTMGDDEHIHVMGEKNCFGYPNFISIYPPDIFGHENYGTTRHVARWKLRELRKTYNRLMERGNKMKATSYNGWKNRATWNVALWISNDEGLYREAVEFMKGCKKVAPYVAFIKYMGLDGQYTPDRIKWDGQRLDYKALNDFMKELRGQ